MGPDIAHASMEGRAIARPNLDHSTVIAVAHNGLQWRAEQLPGQTRFSRSFCASAVVLQWRVEQLPGQTGPATRRVRSMPHGFNGGPSNCPAKLCEPDDVGAVVVTASMEGRAIARPNADRTADDGTVDI